MMRAPDRDLARDYAGGLSLRQLCARYHMSISVINRRLRRVGVPLRSRGGARGNTYARRFRDPPPDVPPGQDEYPGVDYPK
jgi:hypothetical protein